MLTSDYLHSIITYDRETGEFVWARTLRGRRMAGRRAGGLNSTGYWVVGIDGTTYYGHHLAWLYVRGEWPDAEIDHRDTLKSNNAFENLRKATGSQNNANKKMYRTNTTGFKGVVLLSSGRFRAGITHERKFIHLGCFERPEDASVAYAAAAHRLFGEFARAA